MKITLSVRFRFSFRFEVCAAASFASFRVRLLEKFSRTGKISLAASLLLDFPLPRGVFAYCTNGRANQPSIVSKFHYLGWILSYKFYVWWGSVHVRANQPLRRFHFESVAIRSVIASWESKTAIRFYECNYPKEWSLRWEVPKVGFISI